MGGFRVTNWRSATKPTFSRIQSTQGLWLVFDRLVDTQEASVGDVRVWKARGIEADRNMNLSIGQQQSLAFAVRVVAEVSGLRAREWSEFGFARRRFPTGPWLGFARATDAPTRTVSTDRKEVGPRTPATQKSCIMTRITAGRGDCPDRKRRGRGRCSDIESGYY